MSHRSKMFWFSVFCVERWEMSRSKVIKLESWKNEEFALLRDNRYVSKHLGSFIWGKQGYSH